MLPQEGKGRILWVLIGRIEGSLEADAELEALQMEEGSLGRGFWQAGQNAQEKSYSQVLF